MKSKSYLTLGPLLFNWAPKTVKDFYFKIAEEAPIDSVYLGEIVCSKRAPFVEPLWEEIARRLEQAGKEVIYSTRILIESNKELESLRKEVQTGSKGLIEANDVAAIHLLTGKPHCVGPYINVYNEHAFFYLVKQGAIRVTLPFELPKTSVAVLAQTRGTAQIEIQVFGRQPLAISARCAHARASGLQKQNCQYVCGNDPDGMSVFTLTEQPFLTVNGLQTMSYTYCNLIQELPELQNMDISYFRLSPHHTHMVKVAQIFRDVLDQKCDGEEGVRRLQTLLPEVSFSNGFYENAAGHVYANLI